MTTSPQLLCLSFSVRVHVGMLLTNAQRNAINMPNTDGEGGLRLHEQVQNVNCACLSASSSFMSIEQENKNTKQLVQSCHDRERTERERERKRERESSTASQSREVCVPGVAGQDLAEALRIETLQDLRNASCQGLLWLRQATVAKTCACLRTLE